MTTNRVRDQLLAKRTRPTRREEEEKELQVVTASGEVRWWCEWCMDWFPAPPPKDPKTDQRNCPACGHGIDDKFDIEEDIGIYPMGRKRSYRARRLEMPATATKPKAEPKQKVECLCGCGQLTGGKWFPGHDAKYHGAERKVKQGVMTLAEFKRTFPSATVKAESPNIDREAGTLPAPKPASERFAALKEKTKAAKTAKASAKPKAKAKGKRK